MSFVNKLSETVAKIHESDQLHKFLSITANSVFYRMTIAFGLFFLGPSLGFVYLGVKAHLLGSNELLYCFLGVFVFSLLGYVILKQISDSIMHIETQMARKNRENGLTDLRGDNELGNIVQIADSMDEHLRKASKALTWRMQEINALRELGDLSVFKVTAQTLLDVTMQKVMFITGAIGGAVFSLPRQETSHLATCQHIRGEGMTVQAGRSVPLPDFPAMAALRERTVMVLHREQTQGWGHIFDSKTECAVAIPFDLSRGSIGLAILIKDEGRIWEENGLGFLATFYTTIGSMLRMQELGLRGQETTDELRSVLSIIKIINSDLTEKDLLIAISRRLCEVVPGQWVGLALTDETGSHLRLTHTFHRSVAGERADMLLQKDTSLFQAAIDAAELVSIEDLKKEHPFFEMPMFAEIGLTSCLLKRLDANGKAIGAICLGSDTSRTFSRRDKRMFTMVAMGIALALEQTRLLAKEREKSGELEVLNRISTALTSTILDIDRVLNNILEMVSAFIKVEAGAIMLIQDDVLTVHATTGEVKKNLDGLRIRIGQEGVSGWVAATGESVIVQDVEVNPQFCADIDKRTGFKTRNLLCVPLISNGRVIGVIELLNKKGGTFGDEDLRAVKSVASSTAIALENCRLYGESRHLAQKERLIRTIFQRYVPEEIVNDILKKGASDQLTVGERKIVTVFNVDIRGYSAMSKQAATEDVVDVLNSFFMKMGNIVLKHKGILDKYLGDGLLAIFGAPVSTKNPALDATLAAIAMIEEIETVSRLSLERCGVPLKIGISINTGEAIVGNIGFSKKMEYTVIGDVVNETFRIQDLTRRKTNSILISESTYQQVKLFVYANQWRVKKYNDKEGAVDIYEVIGRKDVSHDIGYHPLGTDPQSIDAKIH